jgi:uncharacterized iron-regulated membrane protein
VTLRLKLPLRTAVFWTHLAIGLAAGLVILVMSVSGLLLTYERQILAWAERDYRSTPAPDAVRLPLETLVATAADTVAETPPSRLTVEADPRAPVAVSLGRREAIYLDPYTGAVAGGGSERARALFRAVTAWHRWLGAEGERRGVARAVTGAANLLFFLLLLTGSYLWLPRIWSWRRLRNVSWFRRGLDGRARDFNWHSVFGLWMVLPLVIVVGSGVVISYSWAGDLLYRVAGESPPARGRSGGPPPRAGAAGGEVAAAEVAAGVAAGVSEAASLDEVWQIARDRVPDWQSASLRLPEAAGEPVEITLYRGLRARPDLRVQLAVDPVARQVVRFEPYAAQSRGRRLRTWVRWLHTGEAGGVAGQTLAGIACGATVVLIWTGFALSWRRFFGRRTVLPIDTHCADQEVTEP